MNASTLIQERLKQKLTEAKVKNPRTSIRSFARQMKVSPGTMSLVLLGKRKISKDLALQIAEGLNFDPIERSRVLAYFDANQSSKGNLTGKPSPHAQNKKIAETLKPTTVRLTPEKFDLLSEWYYFGILSLVQTDDFNLDTNWIAKRLGIETKTAQVALKQLIEIGLIQIEEGKAKRTFKIVRTPDSQKQASLKKANLQNIELAKRAANKDELECSDFTWINLPVDTQQFDQMKLMIRDFQLEFIKRFGLEKGANEVLRVCVQAFPITQRKAK